VNNFIAASRGSSPGGLVRYLFGPGDSLEHTDQRIIAAAQTLGYEDGVRLDHVADAAEIYALGKDMDSYRVELGVEPARGWVWHCAISMPPEESAEGTRLTDAQWAKVARTAMERMGFDGPGVVPCRWIAVNHGLSVNGNDHIHLAVNLVREDGTIASTWNDRRTMSKLCADFEREFGRYVVEGRAGGGMPGYSKAEHQRAKATGQDPDRIAIARTVRACATLATTEAEFVRRAKNDGLLVRPRYGKGGRDVVVGYSVALPLEEGAAGKVVWLGGGRLAADLTLPKLREGWSAPDAQVAAEALAEWGRPAGVAGPRGEAETTRYAGKTWQQAAARVDRIAAQLRETPHDDVAAWTIAARGTAGLLAALSARTEDQPGALAAAANTLAPSAQTRPGQPRVMDRRRGLADFRGVARVIAQAQRRGGDPTWVLVVVALVVVIKLIALWAEHQAQHRQAAALSAAAGQLAAVYPKPTGRAMAARALAATARPYAIAGLDYPDAPSGEPTKPGRKSGIPDPYDPARRPRRTPDQTKRLGLGL
jgi:hypothetical protein